MIQRILTLLAECQRRMPAIKIGYTAIDGGVEVFLSISVLAEQSEQYLSQRVNLMDHACPAERWRALDSAIDDMQTAYLKRVLPSGWQVSLSTWRVTRRKLWDAVMEAEFQEHACA